MTSTPFENSRREAIIILVIWLFSSLYSGTHCYLYGYKSHTVVDSGSVPTLSQIAGPLESFNREVESVQLVMGIPDWVFYGIVVPWLVCIVLTFIFCIFVFTEDDLGNDDLRNDDLADEGAELP